MRLAALNSKINLVEGRSLPLNIFFVLCHAVLTCLTLSSFVQFEETSLFIKVLYSSLLLLVSALLIILKGFYMYSYLARFAIGLAFLIAGFTKLNDPVGFSETLKNYFEDGSLNVFLGELIGNENFTLSKYVSNALKIAVFLAISEILLAVMLLFHQFYKLAVMLLFLLLSTYAVVAWSDFTCAKKEMYERTFTIGRDNSNVENLLARSLTDQTLRLIEEQDDSYVFTQKQARTCPDKCICLGSEEPHFFGVKYNKSNAFIGTLTLFVFSFILMFTQFSMLPNSPLENVSMAIATWFFILAYGIMNSWFWIVFLSAITLYLALNIKHFGLKILQNSFASLLVLALLLFGLSSYVFSHEPLSDFRNYAIGSNLKNVGRGENRKVKIYVYADVNSGKERFLSEEQHATSLIWEDRNYSFVRIYELDVASALSNTQQIFNPVLSIKDLEDTESLHPLLKPLYEVYFEDLVEVRHKKTQEVTIFRKDEITKDYEKDTNYVVRKFSGVAPNLDNISARDLILDLDLIFIWSVKNPEIISKSDWDKIKGLINQINSERLDVCVISAAKANDWIRTSDYQLSEVAFLNCVMAELLDMCRSNVCLLVLKKGVVAAKYPLSGLPKFETIMNKIN
jgi:uncharacterized membrane protein YphA (DoxX/SURF4 family)